MSTVTASHASETTCMATGEPGKRWKSSQCDADESGRKNASLRPGDVHQGSTPSFMSRPTSEGSVKRKTSNGAITPGPRVGAISVARIT